MSDPRLEPALELITRLAGGDLEARGEVEDDTDVLSAIIVGLNMLAEELSAEQTGRLQAESLLQDEVDAYDRAPGLFCSLALGDLTIIKCNRTFAAALAMPPSALLGRSLDALRPLDQRGDEASLLRSLLEGAELTLNRADGTPLVVSGRATRVDTPHYPRVRIVWRDVTKERSLEAQLMQAQKMEAIGRLSGGIAHDFNNILTVVQSSATFLAEDFPNADRADIDVILDAARRGAALTEQLLAFSKQQVVRARPIQLSSHIREVAPILRRTLGEDVELILALRDSVVEIDPSRLTQVLLNLVINARDAMPAGGVLTIETSDVDGSAALVVMDTGEGMSPEARAHAFEPFFTTKPVGKGTGLGLSTCYGIVAQAGGTIEIKSEPGQGTAIQVSLPLVSAEPTMDEQPAQTGKVAAATERLLLVEDDDSLRPLTRRLLERGGYRVLAVENGLEALNMIVDGAEVDMIVTDVVMPEMSGPELSQELARRGLEIRTLFVSGYTADKFSESGLIDASENFLRKPYRPQELLEAVRAVLDD